MWTFYQFGQSTLISGVCGKTCIWECTLKWHTYDNELGLCAHQSTSIDLGSILTTIGETQDTSKHIYISWSRTWHSKLRIRVECSIAYSTQTNGKRAYSIWLIFLFGLPYIKWCVVRCRSKKTRHVSRRDWATYS